MQSASISKQPAGKIESNDLRKSSVSQMMDRLTIVTCKNTPPEFGAVFVDLVFQDLKHEFQKYLRPVEDPELSQYCKNLTKIKQSDVDNGVLLKDALDDFHDWLKFIEVQENVSLKFGDSERNVVLVTWSNNDLNYYLKNECERKGITRKSYFFDWVDAQELYEVCILSNGSP